MKIDPVFPSLPVLHVSRYNYKFKKRNASPQSDEVNLVDDAVVPDSSKASWPRDVKLLLLFAGILSLVILFS